MITYLTQYWGTRHYTLFLLQWRVMPKPAWVVPTHKHTHTQMLKVYCWRLGTQLCIIWEALSYSCFYILLERTAKTENRHFFLKLKKNPITFLCLWSFCLFVCLCLSLVFLKSLLSHQQTPDRCVQVDNDIWPYLACRLPQVTIDVICYHFSCRPMDLDLELSYSKGRASRSA